MNKRLFIALIVLAGLGVLAAVYGKKALYYLAGLPPNEDQVISCVEPLSKSQTDVCGWAKRLGYPKVIYNK